MLSIMILLSNAYKILRGACYCTHCHNSDLLLTVRKFLLMREEKLDPCFEWLALLALLP